MYVAFWYQIITIIIIIKHSGQDVIWPGQKKLVSDIRIRNNIISVSYVMIALDEIKSIPSIQHTKWHPQHGRYPKSLNCFPLMINLCKRSSTTSPLFPKIEPRTTSRTSLATLSKPSNSSAPSTRVVTFEILAQNPQLLPQTLPTPSVGHARRKTYSTNYPLHDSRKTMGTPPALT